MKLILVLLSLILLLPSAVQALASNNDPQTKLDSEGRIGYAFGDEFSIRFAPKVTSIPYTTCGTSSEGVIRYNKHTSVKSIEFCNGSSWQPISGRPARVDIDYTACVNGAHTGNNGLAGFGAPNPMNMDASCNRADYVMVATDNSVASNDPYDNFYCCKIKLVYED